MKNSNQLTKAERTRQYIIETAAPIFNKKGYAATSLSDLLKSLQLTKGALYGNFKNKDDIASAVFSYNFSHLKNGYMNAVYRAKSTNSIDQLKALVNYPLKEFKMLAETGGCPILNSSVEVDDSSKFLLADVRNAIKLWKKLISGIIQKGIENKEIKTNINLENITILLIALIEGGIMLAKITTKINELQTAVSHAELIIEGLST